jgi:conjugative transfer signal peptidase TraF
MERVERKGWVGLVVGQDKESASQYRATTLSPRFFQGFSTRRSDACASEWRVAGTAARVARRKPFGRPKKHVERIAPAFAMLLIVLAIPVALGWVYKLRITLTDSAAPAGIYRMDTSRAFVRGALVAACLPASVARTGLARGYLHPGDCPAGAEPVAKLIGTLPGDEVDVARGRVAVDGMTFGDSRTAPRDSAGRLLPHVNWGVHRVGPGEVWLFGFNDPRSWDSRYFGPVPLAGVRGVLAPVLTW